MVLQATYSHLVSPPPYSAAYLLLTSEWAKVGSLGPCTSLFAINMVLEITQQ